jgi:DNA-binding HxlR family transcriptional regulator
MNLERQTSIGIMSKELEGQLATNGLLLRVRESSRPRGTYEWLRLGRCLLNALHGMVTPRWGPGEA